MTFQECLDFCESRRHLIGKPVYPGLSLKRLVPVPIRGYDIDTYFELLFENNFYYEKMPDECKAAPEYEPYIFVNNPNDPLGIFGLYFKEFPNDRP